MSADAYGDLKLGRTVAQALRLPVDTPVDVELLGEIEGSPSRVTLRPTGQPPRTVIVRTDPQPDVAENNAAVLEVLASRGYPHAPQLLGLAGSAAIEAEVDGVSGMALALPAGSAEAAIQAFAALHALPVREGMRWERSPAEWLESDDLPLFRLGFASDERDAVAEPVRQAIAQLRAGPWGFVHGHATAVEVLLAPGRATLTEFGRAGFGPQLWDVAAFLLTSGLDGEQRALLAGRYGAARGWVPAETAAAIDLAGILWGIEELLALPRRLIESLGDDVLSERLQTSAVRIERGIREPAGNSAIARQIRAGLWS
ncbi:hypothetical protein AYO38_09335 [bacterium SCGC AG-212-C10]|nr:hypothetical protein AYO38_09335 [bacterium SCGC AG-212-C10]